ncbi:autotransporter outer membrane beta-barrel domain-containing protein (plasmid) [Salmonella enterica]|uniref:Autotransporter outer membrane beta-barrel domain-containing protein n=2 Tax=Salmonella enterica TaxID=28901 RepID=A0A8E9XIJ1_SALER|nr:autotransporter outer membrane beta-barrel domain-containing protein [Salmonella enterica]
MQETLTLMTGPPQTSFSVILMWGGKGLQIGQYASVAADINAGENSHLLIGYNRGNESWENTRKCTVNDNSGVTNCSQPTLSDKELANLPYSTLTGDIHLDKNAALTLGKALYTGAVKAATDSTFSMASNSKWVMSSGSTTGTLKMAPGASIVLSDSTQNNVLNVMGDLEGEGEFELNTRLAEKSGDSIVVHGLASGSYTLKVKDNGGDPVQDGRMQALMSFNNPQQDFSLVNVALAGGYADIGTYRYRLTRQENGIRISFRRIRISFRRIRISFRRIRISFRRIRISFRRIRISFRRIRISFRRIRIGLRRIRIRFGRL